MDPLRPFSGLIRTLWKSNTAATTQADAAATASSSSAEQTEKQAAEALDEAALHAQIRTRLARIGLNDPRRTREVFVETVLVAELGESLLRDPAFNDVVKRVADHIGADARLGSRLQLLLQELAEGRSA